MASDMGEALTIPETQYHGGFHWATQAGAGEMILDDESVQLVSGWKTVLGDKTRVIVKVGVSVIASVEVMSEQVAKSRVGAVLAFGVLGGLSAKGAADRGTLLIHLTNGQIGYFTVTAHSESRLLGKLSPWLRQHSIPVQGPKSVTTTPTVSITDEIVRLVGLRDSGALTEEEFVAFKAKLLDQF